MKTKAITAVCIIGFFVVSALLILGDQGVTGSASSNSVGTMMDLTLTVDPEGWVTVEGRMQNMTTTSDAANVTMFGEVNVTEEGFTTTLTVRLPPENATMFPFNSTSAAIEMEYAAGLLNTDMTFATVLPSKEGLSEQILEAETLELLEYFLNSTDFSLTANYEDGAVGVNLHYTMVANLTNLIGSMMDMTLGLEAPFTIDLDYSQGDYDGAVRAYLLPGFPVSDVEIDLTGNLTDICFNGTIPVIYGNSFGIEINATLLESIQYYAETVLNASIDQEGSLLNMTQGAMECTDVRVEIDPIADTGALVTFRVCVRADDGLLGVPLLDAPPTDSETVWLYLALNETLSDLQDAEIAVLYTPVDTTLDMTLEGTVPFRDLVERLLDSIAVPDEWQGGGVPPALNATTLPSVWLGMDMLNTTIASVEDAAFHVAYRHEDRRVEMNVTTTIDAEGLYENLAALLSDLPPAQEEYIPIQELLSLFEVGDTRSPITFADLTGLHVSSTYANGEGNVRVTLTLEGTVNAAIHDVKEGLLNALNDPLSETPPWQVRYLNDTKIDVISMHGYGTLDNVSADVLFSGIALQPPIDPINATAFTLDRFFNLTADDPFPEHGDQLTVTLRGGRNATHLVTLDPPASIRDPDLVLLDAEERPVHMAWNNISLLDLREVQFILRERVLEAVTLHTPTQDNITETSISLSWTESEDPDFVRFELFQSPSSGVLGTSLANITDRETTIYEIHDLAPGTAYYFTVRILDRFDLYADSNQVSATTRQPIWAQTWFIAVIAGAIVAVTGGALYARRRRGA